MKKLKSFGQNFARIILSSLLLAAIYEFLRWIVSMTLPTVSPFLPNLSSLIIAIGRLISSKDLWLNISTTGFRICISLLLTVSIGALCGLVIGSIPKIHRFLRPSWDFLRSIPPSALFPFLVLLLGIGPISKVATTCFTTTLIYAMGVADATATARELRGRFYRCVGVHRLDWYIAVLLPESLLRSVSSLRIVVSITVALMIVCEMFLGSVDGFGGMIIGFSEALRYADLLAAIAIAGVVGYGFNLIVDSLEQAARCRLLADISNKNT